MSSNVVIPAKYLRHNVVIRHITDASSQDDFGQFISETDDVTEICHFEDTTFQKETKRTKNKEYILDYDVFIMLLPNAQIRQSDQIMSVTTKNGEEVYEDDGGNNPMIVQRVLKIPARQGIHHIEAYCKFRNPNL